MQDHITNSNQTQFRVHRETNPPNIAASMWIRLSRLKNFKAVRLTFEFQGG